MRKKKVEFLRYFNDYIMIAIFPADIVAVSILSFILSYSVFSIGGFKLMITVIGSLAISGTLTYVYRKAKEDTSKGFLRHWSFNNGIYPLKEDKEKWEELKHTDSPGYFPSGQDKFFAD